MALQFPSQNVSKDTKIEQPIECEAVPVGETVASEPPRIVGISSTVAKWLILSFLLVITLKIVGVMILLGILVYRFPTIMRRLGSSVSLLRRSGTGKDHSSPSKSAGA